MASSQSPVAPAESLTAPQKLAPAQPLTTNVSYFLQLWGLKSLVIAVSAIRRFMAPASTRPTLIKYYPIRPSLPNRIFVPRSHVAGTLLPLYIDIHGGGFAICSPDFDDGFCSTFANLHNVLIVSINYNKAPGAVFPVAPLDCAAIAAAVIDDESLPIDKDRVAIGGFSAGGNLSLAAVQLPELKGKIKAVVPWYPVVDFTISRSVKLQRRAYEREGDSDMLSHMGRLFNWGYMNPGQDLADPLLSVRFAKKEDMPKWIYMIAAEYDMLAIEAQDMIIEYAGIENPTDKEKDEFEKGTYRWSLAKGVKHGFTHEPERGAERDEKRLAIVADLFQRAGDWLLNGPFATK